MATKGDKKSGKSVKSVKALPAKHVNESQAGKVRGGDGTRDAASGQAAGKRQYKPITI